MNRDTAVTTGGSSSTGGDNGDGTNASTTQNVIDREENVSNGADTSTGFGWKIHPPFGGYALKDNEVLCTAHGWPLADGPWASYDEVRKFNTEREKKYAAAYVLNQYKNNTWENTSEESEVQVAFWAVYLNKGTKVPDNDLAKEARKYEDYRKKVIVAKKDR